MADERFSELPLLVLDKEVLKMLDLVSVTGQVDPED
jgi:hypothetical protein